MYHGVDAVNKTRVTSLSVKGVGCRVWGVRCRVKGYGVEGFGLKPLADQRPRDGMRVCTGVPRP